MEQVQSLVMSRFSNQTAVSSVLAFKAAIPISPLTGGYDLLLLVVADENAVRNEYTNHYIKDHTYIQERWITSDELERWILSGSDRNIIHWILEGDIYLDKHSYLANVKNKLLKFHQPLRNQKLFVEFSLFLKSFLQSKQYLEKGHTLDAYGNILDALLHWARISIIETGIHPEVMVWQQLRKINPGIYKLYEELTLSTESLKERVQLVLLACDFSVMSKMPACCSLLIQILKSRKQPWSPKELMHHSQLHDLHIDIPFVLKTLTMRSIIKEVIVNDGSYRQKLKYTC